MVLSQEGQAFVCTTKIFSAKMFSAGRVNVPVTIWSRGIARDMGFEYLTAKIESESEAPNGEDMLH
ncbi:cytochrome P450 [Sesbania bispinosa]|nr:cytochrome P450 [Sesbania bispinosa]